MKIIQIKILDEDTKQIHEIKKLFNYDLLIVGAKTLRQLLHSMSDEIVEAVKKEEIEKK